MVRSAIATAPRVALLVGLAFALAASPAMADVENQGEVWLMATARGPITGHWRAYFELQPRMDGSGMVQLLVRPAVGYQVLPNWSIWQGYAWTPKFNPYIDENRSFQQSLVESTLADLSLDLKNRTRLEERWIEGSSGVAMRVRHLLRADYYPWADTPWSLAAYDEVFLNLNSPSGGPQTGFDRNRLFLGIHREMGSGLALEVGYLNQFVNSAPGSPDLLTHVALVYADYRW